MTTEEAKLLISKYNAGNCNEQEKGLLEQWYMQLDVQDVNISAKTIESLRNRMKDLPGFNDRSKIIKLWSVIAAIASISIIGISILLFQPRSDIASTQRKSAHGISPGGNKAILKLANGKTINLSADKTGVIIDQNSIRYNDSTAIVTSNDGNVSGLATISTPNGGEYQITLPDGTKVWLNAATTLQFSANLKRERGERKVRLESGEAYFEVYQDKKRPFVVTTGQQEVFVLGTHFNISAYAPKAIIKTTLQEGAVRITSLKKDGTVRKSILKPGEQAISSDAATLVKKVDVDLELAWKNGKIQFENAELKTVMDMLTRWYDIDVLYKYYPSEAKFTGSIDKTKNISEVLELLQSTGDTHFKIEGRKVLIMR